MNLVLPNHQPQSKHITMRPKASSPLQLYKKVQGNGHAILLDEGQGKTKRFFRLLETRKPKYGEYFTKYHPPHHHREICATYLYMENAQLKIDHKIVHKYSNAVLTTIHTVAITLIYTVIITPNRTVVQGCANVVRTYIL